MIRIPVYQMTYGLGKGGSYGLVFTSELETSSSQSILFTIPVIKYSHPIIFLEEIRYSRNYTIYFPFLLGERYFNLEAEINISELIFTVPETDFQITFEIDLDESINRLLSPYRERVLVISNYVGNEEQLILPNYGFLTLLPVDLYEMDELYIEHKGVFVGLTPNFGTLDEGTRG